MTAKQARSFVENNYGNLPGLDIFSGMIFAHIFLGIMPLAWSTMSGYWWASLPYWVAVVVCTVAIVVVRARPATISYRQVFLLAGWLGLGDSLLFLLFCTSCLQSLLPQALLPCTWLVVLWLAVAAIIAGGTRRLACRGFYAQTPLPSPIVIYLLPLIAGVLGGAGGWLLSHLRSSNVAPIFVAVGFFFAVSAILLLAIPHLLRAHYIKKFSISGPPGLAYTPTAPGQRPLPLRLLMGLGKFLLTALLWITIVCLLVYGMYYILPFFGVTPSPS